MVPCGGCQKTGHNERACWKVHPEMRAVELGGQGVGMNGGRAFGVVEMDEMYGSVYHGQMMAMIEDLQTHLNQALSVTVEPAGQHEEDEEEDMFGYAALTGDENPKNDFAGLTARKTSRTVMEHRNASVTEKLPRSFEQRTGEFVREVVRQGSAAPSGLSMDQIIEKMGQTAMQNACMCKKDWRGTKGSILGRTKNPIRIVLNPHRQGECQIWVIQKCLVTDVSNYDVLLGAAATYRPRLGVDPYKEIVFYRPKWEVGQYQEVATIPLEMIRGRGELAMGVYSAKEEHEKESGEEDASSSGECSDTWKAAFDEEQRALRGKPKAKWSHSVGAVFWNRLGLQALLEAGVKVKCYLQCEKDTQARIVVMHRLQKLREKFPQQLSAAAVSEC